MWKVSPGWRGRISAIALTIAAALHPSRADAQLEAIEGCIHVPTPWGDGDSFLVRLPDKREIVVRLYFVDCIEVDVADVTGKRRLREQARHFGVENVVVARSYGIAATRFVAESLASPFVLHTAFSKAPGRSGSPRFYAFVTTAADRDLGELLVEKGLARAFGFGRETPDGTRRDDWQEHLDDVELAAAIGGEGVWEHCDRSRIVAMRREQREELRALEAIDDALAVAPPEEPIDLNSASLEDLVRVGLRESLADEVLKHGPYETVEQLRKVSGIGPATLAKVRPYLKVEPESTLEKPAP